MSTPLVSILVPAYKAEPHIARAVRSVLAQGVTAWELIIVADDGIDYAAVLAGQGISDQRLRFASTGAVRSGCGRPRNVALSLARASLIAVLDADDAFHPDKLQRMLPLAQRHGMATCALDCVEYSSSGRQLVQTVGSEHEGLLNASTYLDVNFSANVMLIFDRIRIPIRWREDVPVLEDLLFAMAAFDYIAASYHLSAALHDYTITEGSLSTSAGAPELFMATKRQFLRHVVQGGYGIHDAVSRAALVRFLAQSLAAEEEYESAKAVGLNTTFSQILARRLHARG